MSDPADLAVRADAIVVAAGSSRRMGGVDKLAWSIGGRSLLAHAVHAMTDAPSVEAVVLVTTADRLADLRSAPWLPTSVVDVVVGGDRRQDSVRAGVDALERRVPDPEGTRVVLVHDGARPLVDVDLVAAITAASARYGAAIPVLSVVETVKRVADGQVVETVDRTDLVVAQTPQGIRRDVFRRALAEDPGETTWTDEAALLEACRIPVHVVPGDPSNLKVTVPADLSRAATMLGAGDPGRRIGIGQDHHPFGPGAPLRLGGVVFDGVPSLAGHSDGDVVLHAVADAVLGAAGLGDLGRHFPAGPATPLGVDSGDLLASVVATLRSAGWAPATVDLTVVGARPRLGPRLDEMAAAIAGRLGVAPSAVSVKASSGNLHGDEGAGRSISALAVATIEALR